MRLFKAILVGLLAVFSHELAWEMGLKGVSNESVKSKIKIRAVPASSEPWAKLWRQNRWAAHKNNTRFKLPLVIAKR